jgi:hypothetical protein
MGFFSDTRAALDLMNAADAINDCLRATMPYLSKYDLGQPFRGTDWSYIKACVDFVGPKVQYMQSRIQDLPVHKRMTTMVRTMDGHTTGAPGYIMAMSQMCSELSAQLRLS